MYISVKVAQKVLRHLFHLSLSRSHVNLHFLNWFTRNLFFATYELSMSKMQHKPASPKFLTLHYC